jgi:hypothetical protein
MCLLSVGTELRIKQCCGSLRFQAPGSLWGSTVALSELSYSAIVERPVPIDMRAVKARRRFPIALDV